MEKLSKQYTAEELLEVIKRNRNDMSLDTLKDLSSEAHYNACAIGLRLRHMRLSAKLTQQEAAKALAVSNQTLCNWEKGYNDISLRNAFRLMYLYKLCSNEELTKPSLDALVETPMDYYSESHCYDKED